MFIVRGHTCIACMHRTVTVASTLAVHVRFGISTAQLMLRGLIDLRQSKQDPSVLPARHTSGHITPLVRVKCPQVGVAPVIAKYRQLIWYTHVSADRKTLRRSEAPPVTCLQTLVF
jgi:hypothetical protein